MERLKNMGLKKSFVLLSMIGVVISLFLIGVVFMICGAITDQYPSGGVAITGDGVIKELAEPTEQQKLILQAVEGIRLLLCILIPAGCLSIASLLFYRWKLKQPIAVLQSGTTRIREHDLAFTIPEISGDELGQVCAAFEMMRAELLQTNQELWRQAEERKRLNAAFSHDLRNPVTVLKGTVKLLRQGTADERALERLETYVLRLERYVEAMSSIQRLEQMPVQKREVRLSTLRDEVEETARLLAPGVDAIVTVGRAETSGTEYGVFGNNERNLLDEGVIETDSKCLERSPVCMKKSVVVDHGLFLTIAENLIGNAARYAKHRICVDLAVREEEIFISGNNESSDCLRWGALTDTGKDCVDERFEKRTKSGLFLIMTVSDDGQGYPPLLLQEGPKPFSKMEENAAHFGMGLYTSKMLCQKHGGDLFLKNNENGGAGATASFIL